MANRDNSPPPFSRRNLIPRNEGFLCGHCQTVVPPATGTSRNHCPACLTSKHVDDTTPGDRHSSCHGLMPTITYEGTDTNHLYLVQACQICDHTKRNRTAPDDDISQLF